MPKENDTDTTNNDSIVKACFRFMDGAVKHVSFDCPDNLRKALKSTAKAQGQSVCSVLQMLTMAYIIASQACFSNTIRPNVTIQNLTLQRVVMRHRRVYHESEYTDVVQDVVEVGELGKCFQCGTRERVYPHVTLANERVFLCGSCAKRWIAEGKIEVGRA